MEVDRIRKVADMIEAHPEHFDQSWFLRRYGNIVPAASTKPRMVGEAGLLSCGTTACTGGWAVGLWPAEVGPDEGVDEAAARILGLTREQAWTLFYDSSSTGIRSADTAARYLRGMADDYEAASA